MNALLLTVTLLASFLSKTSSSMVDTLVMTPYPARGGFSTKAECEIFAKDWGATQPQIFDLKKNAEIPSVKDFLGKSGDLVLIMWCVQDPPKSP
jgi:hypothetical protein